MFFATAGAWLLYVGVRDVDPLEGLRSLLRGEVPAGRAEPLTVDVDGDSGDVTGGGAAAGGGQLGARIAAEARKHEGVPYKWGGNTRNGWDCSGFANYVLRAEGVTLPVERPTTNTYWTWDGAVTVPRSDTQAGDLVMYPGHMGIALDRNTMIHAPTAGQPTKISRIWPTPTIRRVKG